MNDQNFGRRDFLKGAVIGGAAAATTTVVTPEAQAQQPAAAPQAAAPASPGYSFLNLEEAAFVEALVDHMVPADDLTPKGTDIGINIYIDRALAGAWGNGDRLYMQGPWKPGVPSQGYGKPFEQITEQQREEVLVGLSTAKITFDGGPPVRPFWTTLYQTVIEGMFSDPIYGGNRNKAGWKLIGFPGAIAVHRENVEKFRGKPFPNTPTSIADMS
jgi:gluconate 2-dehydrogenase gamma chain